MQWTGKRSRTDVWRAGIGLVLIIVLLFVFTGCVTDKGPRMTLATSYEGDGFIRLTQPVYEHKNVECFVEYEHHSEILNESNEDVGDFGLGGCSYQFEKWLWQK